jgi:signal transduction histidine kinase/CheY-like chemotaxis protein
MATAESRPTTSHPPPAPDDLEYTRQLHLLSRLLLTMVLLTALGAVTAFFDPKNDKLVTTAFYLVVGAWFALIYVLTQRGRVRTATWLLATFFWILIAIVTLFFGGMQGQNASTFAVCTLLVGSVIGARAALVMAGLSSAWCAFVAYLEGANKLPTQLGPYSPINSWSTVTITVSLTTVLLITSLQSLRQAYAKAQQTAIERDEALRRSIQGQKMEVVGNLTSGIAHDLNNLLTVIVGATDVLRADIASTDDDARALVEDLDYAASRAALMTRQLLAFGRAPTDERTLINASEILAGIGRMLPRVLGSHVTIKLDIASDCWILGSRSGLEQVALNLAVNARDAMSNGGTLTFELQPSDSTLTLWARDTGTGIPTQLQDRVFEPFFSTKAAGTGLGLSTVRRLVEHHQGTIAIEQTSPNGTVFRLSFPRAILLNTPPRVEEVAIEPSSGPARLRILVVEDDPLVRHTLLRLLDRDAYDILAVSDGLEALAVLRASQNHFHCMVSDVAMPNLDGEELARIAEIEFPELPLILISGNREPLSPTNANSRRVFLRKPFAAPELNRAIRRVTQPIAPSVNTMPESKRS